MQALYAYFRDEKADIKVAEKNLFTSIDKSYELFLYILGFLNNLQFSARISVEEAKTKRLPTAEDLNPNLKFVNNLFLTALNDNKHIKTDWTNYKVSWQNDQDLVRKVFNELRNTELYKEYMQSRENNFAEDKKFIQTLLETFLYEHELFNFWFDEKNIYWTDDYYYGFFFLNKWAETVAEAKMPAPQLYRDKEGDEKFIADLFVKTILHSTEFDTVIAEHTKNWELDRIAILDVLLMKMALTEIMYLPNVPVKVSMNEYIDITKEYSTPQSGGFINGILDKIVLDLKKENKIQKTGRGLLEG
ncbi:MAG TPA: transcription antitermination factor NusB [Bacteroidia bacterium]|nr:transcription antitermination factor NusB [Bacteroidia bacterium]